MNNNQHNSAQHRHHVTNIRFSKLTCHSFGVADWLVLAAMDSAPAAGLILKASVISLNGVKSNMNCPASLYVIFDAAFTAEDAKNETVAIIVPTG